MALSEGAQFAGYSIVRLLGAGGMGEVYLARHPRLPRLEALKILRADVSADLDYRQRFNREADVAAGLWHPHIVGVHDRGEFDGQLWIAMDYVNGPDLNALLAQHYPAGMPTAQALGVVTAIAAALDYAHHRGLLHRDVKPANMMITDAEDGGVPRILLTDFGIARAMEGTAGLTVTNMTIGTVDYCAPEQLKGAPVSARADQYALAASAYHLLTGAKLFSHVNPVGVISAHLTQNPPLPSGIRPDLAASDAVFARALAKNPDLRFDRCADFAAGLTGQLQHTRAPCTLSAAVAVSAALPQAGVADPTAARFTPAKPHSQTPGPSLPSASFGAYVAPVVTPRRRRKRLAVAAFSLLAVVASLAALGTYATRNLAASRGSHDREAARLAGQHYLEALATGDAKTALSLGVQQASSSASLLLTDKALRTQLAATPISGIEVTHDPSHDNPDTPDAQRLMLAAKFGTTASHTIMWARKKDGRWKLDTTMIAVPVEKPGGSDEAMNAVAISGVSTNGASPVWVLPGTLTLSSTNRNVDISATPTPLLLEALGAATIPAAIQPVVTLNDGGRQAALTVLDAKARYCFNGSTPAPECCPKEGCRSTGSETEKLLHLESTQDMSYTLDSQLWVHVTGIMNYVAEVRTPSTTVTLRDAVTVDRLVDLTKQPPVVMRK